LRAKAALGAIRRPLTIETAVDLTDAIHQKTLIDAAVATPSSGPITPNQEPVPPTRTEAPTEHP
jgi:hypothetical protein